MNCLKGEEYLTITFLGMTILEKNKYNAYEKKYKLNQCFDTLENAKEYITSLK